MPAYVVLSNATVAEIAAAQPRNPRELSRISGIGPTKLERYGEDILRIVTNSTGRPIQIRHSIVGARRARAPQRRPMLIPIVGVIVIAALVTFLVMQRKKVSH